MKNASKQKNRIKSITPESDNVYNLKCFWDFEHIWSWGFWILNCKGQHSTAHATHKSNSIKGKSEFFIFSMDNTRNAVTNETDKVNEMK